MCPFWKKIPFSEKQVKAAQGARCGRLLERQTTWRSQLIAEVAFLDHRKEGATGGETEGREAKKSFKLFL